MATTELLTLNADGTTTVHLVDRNVVLRRPTLGEFRKMREALEGEQDTHAPKAAEVQGEAVALGMVSVADMTDAEVDAFKERQTALRIATRETIAAAEGIRERFFTNMLATLAPEDANATEAEYPPQVLDQSWILEVIQHWRSRPTDPGVI